MQRKLIELGGGCLVVSIPSKFVKAHGLKKGDNINVDMSEDSLKIYPQQTKKELKKSTIDVKDLKTAAIRAIVVHYRIGYDEFTLTYSDPEFMKELPGKVAEVTIGLTVLEQKKSSVTLRDLSVVDEEQLPKVKNRLWFLLKDLARDLNDYFQEKNYQELKNLYYKERTINQFMNYTIRLINKSSLSTEQKTAQFYFYRQLESIGDAYRDLATSIAQNKIIPQKEFVDDLQKVISHTEEFHKTFQKFSLHKTERLLDSNAKLQTNLKNNLDDNLMFYFYLFSIAAKIRELISPMMEIHYAYDADL